MKSLLGSARILWLCWREHHRPHPDRPIPGADEAIAWTKPPASGEAPLPPRPVPGHHRGNHLVIDCWQCGCLYTWTRHAGWVRDFDCLDEEIRKLLTP